MLSDNVSPGVEGRCTDRGNDGWLNEPVQNSTLIGKREICLLTITAGCRAKNARNVSDIKSRCTTPQTVLIFRSHCVLLRSPAVVQYEAHGFLLAVLRESRRLNARV